MSHHKEKQMEKINIPPSPEFFADYNPQRLQHSLKQALRFNYFTWFFPDGIHYQGVEHLEDVAEEQIIFFGNHVSHFDYVLAGRLFLEHLPEEKMPHILAGKNLQVVAPVIRPFFDYYSSNLCWVDRKRASTDGDYAQRLKDSIDTQLLAGDSFMTYPEGGRRLYPSEAIHSNNNPGLLKRINLLEIDPYLVTLTVDYDTPVEGSLRSLIEWGRKEHPKVPSWFSQGVYFGADLLSYGLRYMSPFDSHKGAAYLRVGEPQKYSDLKSASQANTVQTLRSFYTESIQKDYQAIQNSKQD